MGRIVVPSQLDQVDPVRETVLEAVRAAGVFDREAQFGIRLALEEAVVNAVRHGNKLDPAKQVTIEFEVSGDACRISVCDEGPGFEPDTVPDPTLDENLTRPHGRGVMLMRAYMTNVSFNEAGNCVTMVKRADCPAAGEAADE